MRSAETVEEVRLDLYWDYDLIDNVQSLNEINIKYRNQKLQLLKYHGFF